MIETWCWCCFLCFRGRRVQWWQSGSDLTNITWPMSPATGSTYISKAKQDISKVPTAKWMLSPQAVQKTWQHQWPTILDAHKYKMAAFKPEVPVSRSPGKIFRKFQRLNRDFPLWTVQQTWWQWWPTFPYAQNPIWLPLNRRCLYLSNQARYLRNSNG